MKREREGESFLFKESFSLAKKQTKKPKKQGIKMTENEIKYTELDTLEAIKESRGKILSVDFGDVRTGLAVSDASRLLASGIGYISVGGIEKTAEAIAQSAKENGAVAIIVGLPVNMDGSQGSRAERCKKLARLTKEASGLLVSTYDERMTTMTAARYLNETNTRGKKRKGVIDTLSAQIILQNCLDRLKNL